MIIVAGASGFIGKHLINKLAASQHFPIVAVTRNATPKAHELNGVRHVKGDVSDMAFLKSLIDPGATFINLIHSNTDSSNDAVKNAENIVNACVGKGAKRLIHCSSISVYGRVSGAVNEETICKPLDHYGKMKLAFENELIERANGRIELIILRPSEVFGVDGKSLNQLISSLKNKHWIINYLRSSLYGRRRMHFVPVEAVVDAIEFFINDEKKYNNEILNVTYDDEPLNNYRDIELILQKQLGLKSYPLPLLKTPQLLFESLLRLLGRSTISSQLVYSSVKLNNLGLVKKHNFEHSLINYAKYQKMLGSVE